MKLFTKKSSILLALILIVAFCIPTNVTALKKKLFQQYAENNIWFYEGDENLCEQSPPISINPGAGGNNERLAEIVREYGELAMDLQRKWGTPWEVVFAQMLHESSVGTAGVAKSMFEATGKYNWLGISGNGSAEFGAGGWKSSNGRTWAQYDTIENMISDWAGRYIARNCRYDAAFNYLDPDNYDLENFLYEFISVYAPASDGNDVGNYVSSVLATINGTIKKVREEMGWPSSEELAKTENIPIGGENPLGEGCGGSGTNPAMEKDDICKVSNVELKPGGMTKEEAENFLSGYIEEAKKKKTGNYGSGYSNGTVIGDGFINDAGCMYGTLNNCVALSQWFVNNYTTAGPNASSARGSAYAGELISSYPGVFTYGGNTPKAYSIGSTTDTTHWSGNHTFVVLGINTESGTIVTGHASCHGWKNDDWWPLVREDPITMYTTSDYTYAHINDDQLIVGGGINL